jgi:hypothetical protein
MYPRISFEERYWKCVLPEPNSGCYFWMGRLDPDGYGRVNIGYFGDANRKTSVLAHRAAYEHFIGAIPFGLEIDHKCRIRCCVNPEHLECVTHQVNIKRGIYKGKKSSNSYKTHCPKGHPYFGENLYLIGKRRQCRICRREFSKNYREKRKQASGR